MGLRGILTMIFSMFHLPEVILQNGTDLLQADVYKYLYEGKPRWQPWMKPILHLDDPITVNVEFVLGQINEVNEKDELLGTFSWLAMKWRDPSMTWSPDDFGGVSSILVPSHETWVPAVLVMNSKEQSELLSEIAESPVWKNSDGLTSWIGGYSLQTTCNMDLTHFPFDTQTCYILYGTWVYVVGELVFVFNAVDKSLSEINNQWKLTNLQGKATSFGPEISDEDVPVIKIRIDLERRPQYYMITLILPCAVLSALSILALILPPESDEKVSLSVAVLTAYTVFLLLVIDILPQTSVNIPGIAIFLSIKTILMGISVAMVVVISYYRHQPKKCQPSTILRFFTFRIVAVLICSSNARRSKRLNTTKTSLEEGGDFQEDNTDFNEEVTDFEEEWLMIARIFDRLFLIVYLFLIVALVVFLSFKPKLF